MNRNDGYRVNSDDPMYQIVPYIMTQRLDATNEIELDIDLEPIQSYIRECRAKGTPVSHMAVIIAAYLRMLTVKPFLNRFCVNKKIYARNHFCVSFVTLVPDKNGETVNKIYFDLDDDIFTVNEKLNNALNSSRDELQDTSMDKVAKALTRLPIILKVGVGALKLIDKVFSLPFGICDASPFHTSLFITNLASIRSEPVFHHLYEFGTTSVFIAMGAPEKKTFINENGDADEKKVMKLRVTMDERIADGKYYVLCFKEISKYFRNPALLETKPESITFDPDVRSKHWSWTSKVDGKFVKKAIR